LVQRTKESVKQPSKNAVAKKNPLKNGKLTASPSKVPAQRCLRSEKNDHGSGRLPVHTGGFWLKKTSDCGEKGEQDQRRSFKRTRSRGA